MALDDDLLENARFEGMIGRSAAMWEAFSRIRRMAPHFRSVLITGETGTGKELAARALHNLSPVSNGRFVVLNCSAVVETLFESEFFGHVRGSFTGATQDKAGLFEFADKGTIFLDEIGDMPIGTQAKLLRTLQNQEVLRVGSLTPRKVDVHVIAATHRDLRAAIAEKEFREDLYYRLSMIEVHMPSLLERKEDLPLLTRYFLEKFSAQFRKEMRGSHSAPKSCWRATTGQATCANWKTCSGTPASWLWRKQSTSRIFPSICGSHRGTPCRGGSRPRRGTKPSNPRKADLSESLDKAGGNQSQAAREFRIGRDALRYKMRKHGLL